MVALSRRFGAPALLLCACASACAGDDHGSSDPLTRGVRPPDAPIIPVPRSAPVPDGRNVLVIIADDLGTDYLVGFDQGDPAVRTPTLARLEHNGVTFTNAWASPVCSPTRAGIYSGRRGFRTGIGSTVETGEGLDSETTGAIPRVIHHDIDTALIGKWHLGESSPFLPSDHGFDRHSGFLVGGVHSMIDERGREGTNYYWEHIVDGVSQGWVGTYGGQQEAAYLTNHLTSEAAAWIDERGSDRWFLVLAYNAPHEPFELPPEDCRRSNPADFSAACSGECATPDEIRAYKSSIECLDIRIGDLLDGIDPVVLERTTVVFLGDNGTPAQLNEIHPSGHGKATLFQSGIRVPLIIADGYALVHGAASPTPDDPGRVSRLDSVEAALVQTTDLFATVVEVMDGDPVCGDSGPACGEDSISLLPYLTDQPEPPLREEVFSEYFEGGDTIFAAIRQGDRKLVWTRLSTGGRCYGLYDLAIDSQERDNLLADGQDARHPARVSAQRLIERIRSVLASQPGNTFDVPDLTGESLCPDQP